MKKGINTYVKTGLACGLVLVQMGTVTMAAGLDTALVGLCSTVSLAPEAEAEPAAETVQTLVGVTVTDDDASAGLAAVLSAETMVPEETAAETAEAAVAEEAAPEEAADEEAAAPEDVSRDAAEDAAAEEAAPADVPETPETSEGQWVLENPDQFPDEEEPEEHKVIDTSMVGTTGFAQCEDYLNVRSDSSADSEPVGKIYNNGSLEILGVASNGWYQVRSGNVEGYVSPDYVATGSSAQEIAASSGYTTATVGADALNVRADGNSDAEIIATIDDSHEIEVIEDQGEWLKVILDGEMYGYIASDYVSTTTEYATGETYEEEQARLDQEWLEYLAEQEALQAAAEAAYLASLEAQETYTDVASSYTDASGGAYDGSANYSSQTVNTSGSADELAVQAQSLYQTYLDAQAAADAAVANGEGEQAIIDTAAAAQAAYSTYLTAQNAADAAAAGMTADTADASASTGSEQAAAVEAPTPAEEPAPAPAEEPAPAPAASSAGQAIANFACQFVGNPYVYGGASLTSGADCSGFTMAVMANFGIGLPHNAAAQSGCGTPVSLGSIQPGDLLFYNGSGGIGHVSIYIGNGQVVHASNPSNGIRISSIGYRTPVAARRFV